MGEDSIVFLANQTQNELIDHILRGVTGLFVEAFPRRLRACYLVGSRADGSAVNLSDLDFRAIFKDRFHGQEEIDKFLRVRQYLRSICPVEIDCPPLDEDRLKNDENWAHEVITIKCASQFLYGEDIRDTLTLPAFEVYLRDIVQAPILFMKQLHQRDTLPYPVSFPDPDGSFYGFDIEDSERHTRSTKMLVHVAGFIASSRLALEAGQIVTRKSDWLPMYREFIQDGWMPFLEEVWHLCKETWGYRVPEDPASQKILRSLCQQFLAFENDYLRRPGTR